MNKGLQTSLIIIGFFFIGLGIALNQIFYNSLAGDVATYQLAYSAIGIGLDISKVVALMLGAALITTGAVLSIFAGCVSLALYVVLASISLTAGWGFSLVVAENYETSRQQSTMQYQLATNSLEQSTATLSQLAAFSAINGVSIQSQIDNELSKRVQNISGSNAGTLAARTANCTNTGTFYFKYCTEYLALNSKLDNYNQYQTALAAKTLAQTDMVAMDSVGASSEVAHPAFVGLSSMGILGATPEIAKYRFLLISFSAIEFIGAIFFVIGAMFGTRQQMTVAEMKQTYKNINDTMMELDSFRPQTTSLGYASSLPIEIPK